MISGWLLGTDQVVARLERMPGKVHDRLLVKITAWALKLEGYVKTEKLSGQVLKVRTDTLRSGVTQRVDESAESIIGRVTDNVAYAARHEYGFKGEESVSAHVRHYKDQLRTIKVAFGRALKEPKEIMVRAHTANVGTYSRKIDYPAHSFLRSALKDFESEINADLKRAVEEVVAEA
jgi:hypothetical protein